MSATTLTPWSATTSIIIIIIIIINTASFTDRSGFGSHYHPDNQHYFGPIESGTH